MLCVHKLVIAVVIISILINIYVAYPQEIEYKTYTSIPFGFMIDYPSDWIVEEHPYYSYIKVSFVANIDTYYKPFLLVGYEELERELSYDEYKTLIIKQQIRALDNFTIISELDTTFINNTAKMFIFEGIDMDTHIKGKIIYTMLNNTVYSIITASKYDMFDEYDDIFDSMINSFRVDKSIIPQPISDIYEDDTIHIKFPTGWKGLVSNINDDVLIRLAPSLESTSNIIITDISDINTITEQLNYTLCTVVSLNFISINGSNALELEQNCDNQSKTFIFTTDTRLILVDFISTKSDYSVFIDSFEKMVQSMEINNLKDITNYLGKEFQNLPIRLDNIENFYTPDNWNIFKRTYNGIEIIYTTPNGSNITSNNYTMVAFIKGKMSLESILDFSQLYNCDIKNIHHISINAYALEYNGGCSNNSFRIFEFDNTTISYITNSNLFDDEFRQIINSLRLDQNLTFSINMLDAMLKKAIEVVRINNTDYAIEYNYNLLSNINDFKFDINTKSITIDADVDSGLGILMLKPSVIEGPYVIILNGKIINLDAYIGSTLAITYADNANIKIMGTNVIPEFPLPLLITIIGLLITITKYRWLYRLVN
ncbi:MAG: hypothetical protein KatS3mg003_1910 [Candidatus Nitrosocaldaceae archaeon]|nr:MAG: hypothetical protein KatS3mg003_1910 [Candidatus Nitrosocaldaceae archaeon]